MPQFFDSRQYDYGGNAYGAGIASAGNSIASALNANTMRKYEMQDWQKKQQVNAGIQDQQRQTELERQVSSQAGQYGVTPVVGRDGKLDVYATAAAALKAKDLHDRIQSSLGYEDQLAARNKAELTSTAREYGIQQPPANGASAPFNAPSRPAMGMDAPDNDTPAYGQAPQNSKPLEQQVREAKDAAQQSDYQRQRKFAADTARETAGITATAKELSDFRTSMGRDPNPDELTPEGRINGIGLNAAATKAQDMKLTQTQKNARASVQAAIATGSLKPEDADAAYEVYQQSGGKAPTLPQSLRDQITTELATKRGLKTLNESVAAAGDKVSYGPVSFRRQSADFPGAGLIGGRNPDARSVDQAYNDVKYNRAFAQGGKALTPAELQGTVSQIGAPTDSDFQSRLSQFGAAENARIGQLLEQLQTGPNKYSPEAQQLAAQLMQYKNGQAAAQAPGAGAPAGAGQTEPFKILSIKQVR